MKKNSIKGFTLIEVILSIALLGIIALFILPMTMYGVKYSKWNNIKLTALNLGYSQIEWLKALDYDELGLDISNYSPNGNVKENLYINDENSDPLIIEGIEYSLITNVTWEDAISSTGEPVSTAIKKIDVTVEARDPFSGVKKEYSVLGSLVTKESEREPTYPGHLKIYTYFQDVNSPRQNVMIRVRNDSGALIRLTKTDNEGRALIGELIEGMYNAQPLSWEYDELMVMPSGVINNVSVPRWRLEESVFIPKWNRNSTIEYPTQSFFIDLPGYLNLPQNNNYPNATLTIKPTSGSYNPPEGETSDNMILVTNLVNLNQTKFWRLWSYEYDVAYGDEIYYLVRRDNGYLWNGNFEINETNEITQEELSLSFALKDLGTYKIANNGQNGISEINIEFTSEIADLSALYEAQISLSNTVIDSNEYTIYSSNNGNKDKIKIIFHNPITGITESEISFEIINFNRLENRYGMRLAKDLNKCTLKLIN